jgi:hypothetical protein
MLCPSIASKYLQDIQDLNIQDLNLIQNWLKLWRIKVNENKSIHVTFITRTITCPVV